MCFRGPCLKLNLLAFLLILALLFSACGRKTKEELFSEGVRQLKDANPGGAVVLFKNALEKDENYLDARFQLARAYAALGKNEQSEKEFLKVLRQNPSRDEVLLELAALNNAMKRGDRAFRLAERYLSRHPGDLEGLEVLGISRAVGSRFDEAESYLLQALAADPGRTKTKLELASVYVSSGRKQKAKSLLEELLGTDPKVVRAYYLLAAIEKSEGNQEKALEIYQRILAVDSSDTLAAYKCGLIHIEKSDLNRAARIAEDLIRRFPQRAHGYCLKGLVNFQRENYADATSNFNASLNITPLLEAYYFLGLCYYNRGELENALNQFRCILDVVPDSREARLMTGMILIGQKRLDDAINEIQKVLQKNDGDAIAHNLLGNVYIARGFFNEGMREFSRANQIDPKIVDAYLRKGYFYFNRGEKNEVESGLASAVRAAPDILNNRLMLASYYLKSGSATKALAVLKAGLSGKKSDACLYNSMAAICFSLRKQDEGIKYIKMAKNIDPLFPASYQNMATYYAAMGDFDNAIEEYAVLLKNDPKNLRAILGLAVLYEKKGNDSGVFFYLQKALEIKAPAAYLANADYYFKRRDVKKAIKVLDEALKIDAHNLNVLEMKGRVLLYDRKFKEAVRIFEEVENINPDAGIAYKITVFVAMKDTEKAVEQVRRNIARNPGSARGYMVLGSIFENQKDYPRAIREVQRGVSVEPGNVRAILYLGKLHEIVGDYRRAMILYQDACDRKPRFVPALFAQGALLDITGKKREAADKYRAVLEISDNYVPALNNLAYLCASGYGSAREALRFAAAAYRNEPDDARTMDTYGFALLKNNRYDEAISILEKAVSLLPGNPTMYYHLAVAYRGSGDRTSTLRLLRRSLSFGEFPESNAAASLAAELKR